MGYEITSKERKNLKKIAERIAVQSDHHTANIREYYKVMAEVARLKFYEDGDIALNNFLLEQFREAMSEVFPCIIKFNGDEYRIGQEIYFPEYDQFYKIESFSTDYSVIVTANVGAADDKPSLMKLPISKLPKKSTFSEGEL